jgi:hypothetical protein
MVIRSDDTTRAAKDQDLHTPMHPNRRIAHLIT